MAKKQTIRYQMLRILENLKNNGIGNSKRAEKLKNNGRSPYIHSYKTFETYKQQIINFTNYLKANNIKPTTLDEAKTYIPAYLETKTSAWTQSTARSALAKVYQLPSTDICDIKIRRISDIKRGRTLNKININIAKKHPDLVRFCKATGLRNESELKKLTYRQAIYDDGEIKSFFIKGKGGRIRYAIVIESERSFVTKYIEKAQENKSKNTPLLKVPKDFNAHYYRSDYARQMYDDTKLIMGVNSASKGIYKVKDKTGRVFDKAVLSYVSQCLGHGDERYQTIIHNYLYVRTAIDD